MTQWVRFARRIQFDVEDGIGYRHRLGPSARRAGMLVIAASVRGYSSVPHWFLIESSSIPHRFLHDSPMVPQPFLIGSSWEEKRKKAFCHFPPAIFSSERTDEVRLTLMLSLSTASVRLKHSLSMYRYWMRPFRGCTRDIRFCLICWHTFGTKHNSKSSI